ncbi:ectoine/hydroxyectoine ABC transporter substrate-binding protein EhuB [Quisquiliibacterium transsilvanicum]
MRKLENLAAPLAILLVSILLAIDIASWSAGETLDRYARGQPVRVGYALESPFTGLDAGRVVTGTEPELLRLALESAGIDHIEWVHADFASLLNELRTGRIDIICAGMLDTKERRQLAAFSLPTLRVSGGLAIRPGLEVGARSLHGIAADPALRLGVVAGSVEHDSALRAGVPEHRIMIFPDVTSAGSALNRGEIDTLALSYLTLERLQRAGTIQEAELVAVPRDPEGGLETYTAFAVRLGDDELLATLNRSLEAIVGTGQHRELLKRFGVPDHNVPEERPSR